MFHQSGGCCDGSSPMCYPRGEFLVGDSDVQLGEVDGEPFYMSKSQFEYWKHTQLTLDVVPGRGGMFSLDNGEGVRFLIRSRIFDDAEIRRAAGGGTDLRRGTEIRLVRRLFFPLSSPILVCKFFRNRYLAHFLRVTLLFSWG